MVPILVGAGLPAEGIGVLLGIDAITDMFRTATNVTGDMAGAVVLGRRAAGDRDRLRCARRASRRPNAEPGSRHARELPRERPRARAARRVAVDRRARRSRCGGFAGLATSRVASADALA